MQLAGGGDDAVDLADLAKEALDAGRVGAVDAVLTARRTHLDHFMACFQGLAHTLADRSGCAYHDDFFHLLLRLVFDAVDCVGVRQAEKACSACRSCNPEFLIRNETRAVIQTARTLKWTDYSAQAA
jgi:hypothetical protein